MGTLRSESGGGKSISVASSSSRIEQGKGPRELDATTPRTPEGSANFIVVSVVSSLRSSFPLAALGPPAWVLNLCRRKYVFSRFLRRVVGLERPVPRGALGMRGCRPPVRFP